MKDAEFMMIMKAKVQGELNKLSNKEKQTDYDKGMKTAYENVMWLIDKRLNPKF